MTALRERYLRDLAIRGKAERTQQIYTAFVADLAKFHHQSPDLLSYDQVADWLYHLIRERKSSPVPRSTSRAMPSASCTSEGAEVKSNSQSHGCCATTGE